MRFLLVALGALLLTGPLAASPPEGLPASLEAALAWWPEGPPQADHVLPPETFGFGEAALAGPLAWPFCDQVSIIVYSRQHLPVSSSGAIPVPFGGNPCGGNFGAGRGYRDLTFDLAGQDVVLACVAAAVLVGGVEVPAGAAGGYDCSWEVACFTGYGAFGSYGSFGLIFTYVLGTTGTVVAGDDATAEAHACVP